MTEQERDFARNEWHLGSMNDGLFIIDTPPRPSTDEVHHDRKDGPTLVLNVTDLPHEKAQAIVDAHNRALRILAATPAASSVATDEMVVAAAIAVRGVRNPYITPETEGTDYDRRLARAAIGAALSDVRPGSCFPAGVLVPEEPTDTMIEAMDQILGEMHETDDGWPVSDVVTLYKAAIAAAKTPE